MAPNFRPNPRIERHSRSELQSRDKFTSKVPLGLAHTPRPPLHRPLRETAPSSPPKLGNVWRRRRRCSSNSELGEADSNKAALDPPFGPLTSLRKIRLVLPIVPRALFSSACKSSACETIRLRSGATARIQDNCNDASGTADQFSSPCAQRKGLNPSGDGETLGLRYTWALIRFGRRLWDTPAGPASLSRTNDVIKRVVEGGFVKTGPS